MTHIINHSHFIWIVIMEGKVCLYGRGKVWEGRGDKCELAFHSKVSGLVY